MAAKALIELQLNGNGQLTMAADGDIRRKIRNRSQVWMLMPTHTGRANLLLDERFVHPERVQIHDLLVNGVASR